MSAACELPWYGELWMNASPRPESRMELLHAAGHEIGPAQQMDRDALGHREQLVLGGDDAAGEVPALIQDHRAPGPDQRVGHAADDRRVAAREHGQVDRVEGAVSATVSGGTELLCVRGRVRPATATGMITIVPLALRVASAPRSRTMLVPGSSSTAGPRTSAIRAEPDHRHLAPALAAHVHLRACSRCRSRRPARAPGPDRLAPERSPGRASRRSRASSRGRGPRTPPRARCGSPRPAAVMSAGPANECRSQRHLHLPHLARVAGLGDQLDDGLVTGDAGALELLDAAGRDRGQRLVHPLALEPRRGRVERDRLLGQHVREQAAAGAQPGAGLGDDQLAAAEPAVRSRRR